MDPRLIPPLVGLIACLVAIALNLHALRRVAGSWPHVSICAACLGVLLFFAAKRAAELWELI